MTIGGVIMVGDEVEEVIVVSSLVDVVGVVVIVVTILEAIYYVPFYVTVVPTYW